MTIMGFQFGNRFGTDQSTAVHIDRRSAPNRAGSTFLSFPENDFATQCTAPQTQFASRPNGHARLTSAYRDNMAPNR